MLKRLVIGGGLVLVLGGLAIQLVPYGRAHTSPPVLSEPVWDSPATRAYAVTACFDCHSNETKWPWYSNIAPASWLIQHDVDEGRRHMNFSEWGTRGGRATVVRVRKGDMPPLTYQLAHPEARLSEADKAKFIDGLIATFGGD